MTTAYITRIPVDSDQPGSPTTWLRVYVNGEEVTARTTPAGRPAWFTTMDAALAAAYDRMTDLGVAPMTRVEWVPQYDSAFTEALDEPVGYSAVIHG